MKDTFIFQTLSRKYYTIDIVNALKDIGINESDSVFVHSDLRFFGKINHALIREDYLDSFITALKSVLGESGNIIMPTFTYSFCKKEIFDPEKTPSKVGILTEYFRNLKGVKRSKDAIFSVAVAGPDKDFFIDVENNCFGKGSVYEKFVDKNVKMLFFGKTFDMTYLHFIEQNLGLPYRSIKRFEGQMRINGELITSSFDYNVRPLDGNVEYDLERVKDYLERKHVLRKTNLGDASISSVSSVETFEVLVKKLKEDSYFLLRRKTE